MNFAHFSVSSTPLSGLKVITRRPIGDSRGYFERLFCTEELRAVVPVLRVVQINRTLTVRRGTLRGMHFQHPPHAEAKFVSCIRGEVCDVAVDIRQGSDTFLCWHSEVLSAENHKTLVVPEGFAHGFQTLTDNCELLYLHTAAYRPDAEGGLHAQDDRLAIRWPETVTELSARDASHPMLTSEFEGVAL